MVLEDNRGFRGLRFHSECDDTEEENVAFHRTFWILLYDGIGLPEPAQSKYDVTRAYVTCERPLKLSRRAKNDYRVRTKGSNNPMAMMTIVRIIPCNGEGVQLPDFTRQ